jgi:tubulin alpha
MSDDSPLLTLGVGQAGIRQSDALWQLLCAEHDIADSGLDVRLSSDERAIDADRSLWFSQTRADRFVPRTVLIDTDADALDTIVSGARRELYHHGRLVRSTPTTLSAASTWAARAVGGSRLCRCVDECSAIAVGAERWRTVAACCWRAPRVAAPGLAWRRCCCRGSPTSFLSIAMMDLCLMPTDRLAAAVTEPYNAVLGALRLARLCRRVGRV